MAHDPASRRAYCKRCISPNDAGQPMLRGGSLALTALPVNTPVRPFQQDLNEVVRFLAQLEVLIGVGLMSSFVAVASVVAGPWRDVVTVLLAAVLLAPLLTAAMTCPPGRDLWDWLRRQDLAASVRPACVLLLTGASLLAAGWLDGVWASAVSLGALALMPAALLASVRADGLTLRSTAWTIATLGSAYGYTVWGVWTVHALVQLLGEVMTGVEPPAWRVAMMAMLSSAGLLVLSRLLPARCAVEVVRSAVRHIPPETPPMRLESLAREGDMFELERWLWKIARQGSTPPTMHEALGKLLEQRHDRNGLSAWEEQWLAALVKQQDVPRLMMLWKTRLKNRDEWRPADPEVRLALAEVLREQGHTEDAARLLINFHHDHPRFSRLADAYWLLTLILARDSQRPDLARPSAAYVAEHFPQFPERGRVLAFLRDGSLPGQR